MRVFHCEDSHALEAAFRERVMAAAAARPTPWASLTVLAPTARLLTRLQVVAGEALGSAAGISFEVHATLARRILHLTPGDRTALLGSALLERLAGEAVLDGSGSLSRAAARFEGFAAAAASTFRDLRDAGVDAAAISSGGGEAAELWQAYGRFVRHLTNLEARGFTDMAGFLSLASARARDTGSRRGMVLHVGAFDLTGAVRDFVRALADSCPIEILTLGTGAAEAHRFGLEQWARFGRIDAGSTVPALGLYGSAVGSMFTSTSAAAPIDGARREPAQWFAVPSARDELALASRRALRWISDGTPPDRIAFLSRSLDGYAPWIEPVCAEHGLAFTTSATMPLTEHPLTTAFLDALECAARDFPRTAFCRLLRYGPFSRAALGVRAASFLPDRIDAMSRLYAVKGFVGFTQTLTARTRETDGADAALAAVAADRLAREATPLTTARGWREAADGARALARWLARELDTPDGAESARIERELTAAASELAALDGVLAFGGAADFVKTVRESIEERSVPRSAGDGGGVRILDFQQCRGLTFDKVVVMGFHESHTPRTGREDPLLSDVAREELSQVVEREIPCKGIVEPEERWLLALALGSVRVSLTVTFARRDGKGRPRNVSSFARPLARLVNSVDSPPIETMPAHPGSAAEWILTREGILSPRQAIAAAGMTSENPAAAAARTALALGSRDTALERALGHLALTDAFACDGSQGLVFDGYSGPLTWDSFSPTGLEKMGECPMRFFFAEGLHLRELDDPDGDPLLDPRDVGATVHAVLSSLYSDGIWDPTRFPDVASRARQVMSRARSTFEQHWAGIRAAAPAVAELLQAQWIEAIGAFVEEDVHLLTASGVREIGTESGVDVSVNLGRESARLRGRIDRWVQFANGELRVTDYKTGARNVEDYLGAAAMARGQKLQLPLYALAVQALKGRLPGIEAARIHPDLDRRVHNTRRALDSEDLTKGQAALAHAGETLIRFARSGLFPITLDKEDCKFCDFKRACRRLHVPTRERHASSELYKRFYDLRAIRRGGSPAPAVVGESIP